MTDPQVPQYVYGSLARASALAAGRDDWMLVTVWPEGPGTELLTPEEAKSVGDFLKEAIDDEMQSDHNDGARPDNTFVNAATKVLNMIGIHQ